MFTFKKYAKTGSYSSFQNDYVYIKLKKKVCGAISGKYGSYEFMMRVIKNDKYDDGNPNCNWMNVAPIVNKFTNIDEAKEWINANVENWLKENNLELFCDED